MLLIEDISQILFIATTTAETFNATHGGGRHLYYMTPAEIEFAIKLIWIENPLDIVGLAAAKMSVACLMLRLIGPSIFWRKWLLHLSIVMTSIIGALCAIMTFVQCNPPRALWEPASNVPGATCWNPKVQTDFAIFSGSTLDLA